jgi:hypothetical protein
MPTQDELFEEFGRPEAVPPRAALELLDKAGQVDESTVHAFRYYSKDMADAFTGGGRSEPGRQFLGLVQEQGTENWVGAYALSRDADAAVFGAQGRVL